MALTSWFLNELHVGFTVLIVNKECCKDKHTVVRSSERFTCPCGLSFQIGHQFVLAVFWRIRSATSQLCISIRCVRKGRDSLLLDRLTLHSKMSY